MKLFRIYLLIVSCSLALSSCNKKSGEAQQKEQFEDAFNTSEELQEKASQDTNFAKSKEYMSQMEKTAIEMSKQTNGMKVNEKLLLEFELALKNLKLSTEKLKQEPELAKDASFMASVQAKAGTVRDRRQSLQKVTLTAQEKDRFNKLCHQ